MTEMNQLPSEAVVLRTFAHIVDEDAVTSDQAVGRPVLYGYGWGWIIKRSKRARRTVREAVANGLPLYDPAEAVAWALSRRGHAGLANDVLRALGYKRRYPVK